VGAMRNNIVCPHCGVESTPSLIVTVCSKCKGSLAGAGPKEEAPPRPAPPLQPQPAAPPRRPAPPARREPPRPRPEPVPPPAPAVSTPPRAERRVEPPPQPAVRAEETACPHCGYRNPLHAAACQRCRRLLKEPRPGEAQRLVPCPRCGRVQDRRRPACYHCGMHFVGADGQPLVPLQQRPLRRAPVGPLQKDATAALGCIWMGFGLLVLIWIVAAFVGR